jgi:hypothetical protein
MSKQLFRTQVVVPHQVMGRRSTPGSRRSNRAMSVLIACGLAAALIALLGYTHVDENASGAKSELSSLAAKSAVLRPLPLQVKNMSTNPLAQITLSTDHTADWGVESILSNFRFIFNHSPRQRLALRPSTMRFDLSGTGRASWVHRLLTIPSRAGRQNGKAWTGALPRRHLAGSPPSPLPPTPPHLPTPLATPLTRPSLPVPLSPSPGRPSPAESLPAQEHPPVKQGAPTRRRHHHHHHHPRHRWRRRGRRHTSADAAAAPRALVR